MPMKHWVLGGDLDLQLRGYSHIKPVWAAITTTRRNNSHTIHSVILYGSEAMLEYVYVYARGILLNADPSLAVSEARNEIGDNILFPIRQRLLLCVCVTIALH